MHATDLKMGLTQERLMALLSYDPLTGVFTWLVARPNGVKPGDAAGSTNSKGYRVIKVDGGTYKASRLAHLYMTGALPVKQMDHENRDRADNRWSNLREATPSQNCANRLVHNSTGHKGVIYKPARDRFESYIKQGGVKRFLGYFTTAAEAGRAYAEAAACQFGPYARSA